VIPILASACALWLLTGSSRRELIGGLLAFAAGTVLYLMTRRARVVDPAAGRVL
jgi:hypothetical protein